MGNTVEIQFPLYPHLPIQTQDNTFESILSSFFQLQDNSLGSFAEQSSKMEESSDGDYGLEALRAGLSAQSSAPQLMPSKRHHVCWECSERFKTLHDLMEHFDQHQTSGHCQLCQVTFRRGASLAIHLENAHRDMPLICPTRNCRAQLRNRWLLNQHIETCHMDDWVEAGVEVAEEVVEEIVVVKDEVVAEEVVVKEEGDPLLGEHQTRVPEYLLEHMTSDHTYHSTRNPDNIGTDHTYDTRRKTTVTTGHADPCQQYVLSDMALRETIPAQHRTVAQRHMTVNQEVGFLAEGAPLQWEKDGDCAEEEVEDAYSQTDTNVESISDDDDGDSDTDSDSLPPGDSMYVPEENAISHSDSDSSDSLSSGSTHSYTKFAVPSSGVKRAPHTQIMDTGTVVKPLPTLSTSSVPQTCPHCGRGPFLNLKTHIVKCCSRGPERCVKCRKVFSEDVEYICVDCKKTFLGSAARKAHVCPMKFGAAAVAPTFQSLEKQPVSPVLTQLPQLYQIVSLLPPGIIYTQAQSISTSQTSVSPSTSSAALSSNTTAAIGAPAKNDSNSSTPAQPMAAGTFVAIKTPTGTQVANQTVQSNMLLQTPGLGTPSYIPIGNSASNVVKVFAQNSPKTQVFLRGQTPASTPASSVTPGFSLVHSQVPSGSPVSTIAHSQAPSGKPVTVAGNPNQVQMPSAVVLCNQTSTGMQRFIVASNQGQPRAPMPMVIQSQTPVSGAVRHQVLAGAAAHSTVTSAPGMSTATAGEKKPVLHVSTPGSQTLFFPLPNQPGGAAVPSGQQLRVPAPAVVSPQVSQSCTTPSKDSGHPVSSTNTVRPAASSASSQPSFTASVPNPTQNPLLPAVLNQFPVFGSPSDNNSPLIVLSDSGPLRILFMFLNQSRELALAQRMKTRWHYKDVFSCRQCGAISRQPSLVVLHRYRHKGAPRKHRCRCGRRFQARLHLLRHQILHTEATRYICTPCGDSFEGAKRLLLHKANCRRAKKRRKHHLDCWRPFVCTCGLKFVRPSALLWHKLNNSRHKQKARNEIKSPQKHCGDALLGPVAEAYFKQ